MEDILLDSDGNKIHFRNDPQLRSAGTTVPMTQEQISEYQKCYDDPQYFIEKYCKMITNDGLSNFELYDWQKNAVDMVLENPRNMILCSRQNGKCVSFSTRITVRNKKTGKIKTPMIGLFYWRIKITNFLKRIMK